MRLILIVFLVVLGACTPVLAPSGKATATLDKRPSVAQTTQDQAIRNFETALRRVAPVAERFCRQRRPRENCDFQIVVDPRGNLPPNAFQTLDADGRPIIGFTLALIADARNVDEIAFVMAHEAAHHIEGHIPRQRLNASLGAALAGSLASAVTGASQRDIEAATRLGAAVGARQYSKDFELEADATGTRIAAAAGFDPVRGAAFFFRIPDPGDQFLGTHPANADRVRIVSDVAAGL